MTDSLQSHSFIASAPRNFYVGADFWEVIVLESKKNMPEPEMTSEGKYRCRKDNQVYDTREDYDTHCFEEHTTM